MKTRTKRIIPRNKMSKKQLALSNRQSKIRRVNGDNSNNQFDNLKSKYEQEIQVKEGELQVLRAKLASVIELKQDAAALGNVTADPDKYTNMGPTEAVLDAVNYLWKTKQCDGRGVTASGVRNYVLAHGFKTQTRPTVFEITVSITLRRLADAGRIERTESLGRKFYKPKKTRGRSLRFLERVRKAGSLNR